MGAITLDCPLDNDTVASSWCTKCVAFMFCALITRIVQEQGSEDWPYAGLSLLKTKESIIVIQMVQTVHRSANIIHVCKHVLTMFQQRLHLLVKSE